MPPPLPPPSPPPPSPPLPVPPPYAPFWFWQRDDVLDRPWYSSREYLLEWFERDATTLKPEDGLHKLSGWGYLNTTQYQEIVRAAAARLDPPLRDGDSIFELGCGVGGVLSVLAQQYPRLKPAGCDFSAGAIRRALELFPHGEFVVGDMSEKDGACVSSTTSGTFDHVISFGALAMYLTKREMASALRNAFSLVAPGGSVAFTHFLDLEGQNRGTIVEPVARAHLKHLATAAGFTDVRFHGLPHQGDRFMITARRSPAPSAV